MSAADKRGIIRDALRRLGLTSGRVSVVYWMNDANVKVNGKYFGVWNFGRMCFVD